jgi:hypothetical protein
MPPARFGFPEYKYKMCIFLCVNPFEISLIRLFSSGSISELGCMTADVGGTESQSEFCMPMVKPQTAGSTSSARCHFPDLPPPFFPLPLGFNSGCSFQQVRIV